MNIFGTRLLTLATSHQYVADMMRRLSTAGGDPLSSNTIVALNTFSNGLETSGFANKMKSVNCIVPDNLVAARTPLIANYGFQTWANVNFVASDLNVHGLLGASGKYMDTGVIPSVAMTSVNSGGLTVYSYTGNNGGAIELGVFDSSYTTNTFALYINWTEGNSYFDCYGAGSNRGRVYGFNTTWAGFLSGNRYASNATALWKANNSNPNLVTVASHTGTSDQGLSTYKIFFMTACQANSPNGSYYSTKRISFAAIHEGLTQTECQTFYNLVQQLRKDLGGGWV